MEGDFGALALNHTLTDWNDVFPPADLILLSQKTSWYGTLRGRIGTTTGPALLYLTGGAAWVRLQDGVVPTSPASVPGSITSKTGTGWTWGGGTEVALDQHWSAKLESLYVNSGTSNRGVFSPLPAFPAGFKERFVIVRFGLNYAFNCARVYRSSPPGLTQWSMLTLSRVNLSGHDLLPKIAPLPISRSNQIAVGSPGYRPQKTFIPPASMDCRHRRAKRRRSKNGYARQ